jgi:hypothetical protein
MFIDTDQFAAITGQDAQVRSELAFVRGQVARLAEAVEDYTGTIATGRAPVRPAVAARGRARHARPSRWQPTVITGGRS